MMVVNNSHVLCCMPLGSWLCSETSLESNTAKVRHHETHELPTIDVLYFMVDLSIPTNPVTDSGLNPKFVEMGSIIVTRQRQFQCWSWNEYYSDVRYSNIMQIFTFLFSISQDIKLILFPFMTWIHSEHSVSCTNFISFKVCQLNTLKRCQNRSNFLWKGIGVGQKIH